VIAGLSLGPASVPVEPYRGAEEFRFVDRFIFHERSEQTRVLLQKVLVSRGVLVYGDSGSGKSSLVNAGLIPAAIDRGFAVDRVLVQPVLGSEIVLDRIPIGEEGPPFVPSSISDDADARRVAFSIDRFVGKLREIAKPHLLIFDQFEEIFTRFSGPGSQLRGQIFEMLLRLFYSKSLPLNLLLVFREEYFAKAVDSLALAPDWINQLFWLRPPSKNLAEKLIRAPFDTGNGPVTYRQKFSDETIRTLAVQTGRARF